MELSVTEIAERTGGTVEGNASLAVRGLSTVDAASDSDATLISDAKVAQGWSACRARVALVSSGIEVPGHDSASRALIRVPDAYHAMITLLAAFAPAADVPPVGIHASACIDPAARVGDGCRIGPHVSVGAGTTIGAGCTLHAGARIYGSVTMGDGCTVHSNAVIRERSVLGRGVTVNAGAVIGSDGFGYRPAPDGKGLVRIPHIGHVVLEDGVEIGANTCIDRGTFGATVIGVGTKLDNLCQIGHNVRIGRATVMAGLSGVAGSVRIGSGVRIGAGSGIADHRHVGDGAQLAARTALMNDVPAGETWGGMPAQEAKLAMREILALRKLAGIAGELSRLAASARKAKSDA
jgi:UDP-3-O-[3-hydroxymyristoyl] glucosamine N-acyltransferase